MGEMRKLDVTLSEELISDIDRAIRSGDYSGRDDVIAHALELWTAERRAKIEELRALIDEGLASGEPKDVSTEWFDRVVDRALAAAAHRNAAE